MLTSYLFSDAPLDYLLKTFIGPPLTRHSPFPPYPRRQQGIPRKSYGAPCKDTHPEKPCDSFFIKGDPCAHHHKEKLPCSSHHYHVDPCKLKNTKLPAKLIEGEISSHFHVDEEHIKGVKVNSDFSKFQSGLKNSDIFEQHSTSHFQHHTPDIQIKQNENLHSNSVSFDSTNLANFHGKDVKTESHFAHTNTDPHSDHGFDPDDHRNTHVEDILKTTPFKYRLPLENEVPVKIDATKAVEHFPPGHSTSTASGVPTVPSELKNNIIQQDLIRSILPLQPVNTLDEFFAETYQPGQNEELLKTETDNRFLRSVKAPPHPPQSAPNFAEFTSPPYRPYTEDGNSGFQPSLLLSHNNLNNHRYNAQFNPNQYAASIQANSGLPNSIGQDQISYSSRYRTNQQHFPALQPVLVKGKSLIGPGKSLIGPGKSLIGPGKLQIFGHDNIQDALKVVMKVVDSTTSDDTLFLVKTKTEVNR